MMTLASDLTQEQAGGIERRRGLRISQQRPIKVFEPATCRYFPGQTADISATGLRVEMPAWAHVRAGKRLSVHVGLSNVGQSLANRRQMIPARVVWVSQPMSSGDANASKTVTLGLEFVASIAAEQRLDAA